VRRYLAVCVDNVSEYDTVMKQVVLGVVDDDVSVRKSLARLLRSEGFAVQTYSSSEEFLSATDVSAVDCLILDMHLGGMSGLDLWKHLQRAGSATPVIFITAHDQLPSGQHLPAECPPPCLRKPFDGDLLMDTIRHALGSAWR